MKDTPYVQPTIERIFMLGLGLYLLLATTIGAVYTYLTLIDSLVDSENIEVINNIN